MTPERARSEIRRLKSELFLAARRERQFRAVLSAMASDFKELHDSQRVLIMAYAPRELLIEFGFIREDAA